ncbi:MAG: flagellar motor switch protein FliN [Planctomycetes bacterium]|nr:flagellar motor switch protein FliN [Planctomycetota bacterium]MBI3835293.1 flagellar motor switch protein FliN [Planctomycetota bacterium]
MTAAAAGGDDVTSAENALAPAEATAATVETPPSPAPPEATTPQVQGFELPQFSAAASAVDPKRISMLSDVNLNVKIELGRTRMLVEDVLKLGEGSVVELDKLAGDPVDVYANDRLVARGEVLVLNDSFCVRINEVVSGDPHRVTV